MASGKTKALRNSQNPFDDEGNVIGDVVSFPPVKSDNWNGYQVRGTTYTASPVQGSTYSAQPVQGESVDKKFFKQNWDTSQAKQRALAQVMEQKRLAAGGEPRSKSTQRPAGSKQPPDEYYPDGKLKTKYYSDGSSVSYKTAPAQQPFPRAQ